MECTFCKFEHGTSESVIKNECANYGTGYMLHEIRPLINGMFVYFVRYRDTKGEQLGKSSVFIKYCPMCGRKLSENLVGVLECKTN